MFSVILLVLYFSAENIQLLFVVIMTGYYQAIYIRRLRTFSFRWRAPQTKTIRHGDSKYKEET